MEALHAQRLVEAAIQLTLGYYGIEDARPADLRNLAAEVTNSDEYREAIGVPARYAHIDVEGDPAPQGSMAPKGRHVAHADAGGLDAWRDNVRLQGRLTLRALGQVEPVADCALGLRAIFRLPRPRTVTRPLPHVKPDLDKLLRAVGDGLQGEAYREDSQIVRVVAEKHYTAPDEQPGAQLQLWRIGA